MRPANWKYGPGPVLSCLLCLSGCVAAPCEHKDVLMPAYPYAGTAVADELELMCGRLNGCPATEEWLGRLEKMLDSQLAVQQNN